MIASPCCGRCICALTAPGLFPDESSSNGLIKQERDKRIRSLESELDNAVYNLFRFTDEERERVLDFCRFDLDLFYRGMNSDAVHPLDWPNQVSPFGRSDDLKVLPNHALFEYLDTFLDIWDPQLDEQGGRLRWRIVRPAKVPSMLAVIFETETKIDPLNDPEASDSTEWQGLLARLETSSLVPSRSKRVYIDGLVRIVTESEIVIIKRNEHRLWTKSAARDDAEAAMVLAIQLADKNSGGEF